MHLPFAHCTLYPINANLKWNPPEYKLSPLIYFCISICRSSYTFKWKWYCAMAEKSSTQLNFQAQRQIFQNASVHQYDARFRRLFSLLLFRLSISGLFHTLPDLRVLTKRRPWWRKPNWGHYSGRPLRPGQLAAQASSGQSFRADLCQRNSVRFQ